MAFSLPASGERGRRQTDDREEISAAHCFLSIGSDQARDGEDKAKNEQEEFRAPMTPFG
jgi:hypothetical protein